MSRTGGEGRAKNEKSQGLITPYEIRKQEAEKRRQEEQEWAEKSGPVVVRKKDGPSTSDPDSE